MKSYISDIIPKIQAYSKKLDELVKLSNHHWVSLDEIGNSKVVYIFRPNNKLIISDNGVVQKGFWEYIGNSSMVIETKNGNYLLKQGFLDDNILAFKVDSTERYVIFVNETRYDQELNNVKSVEELLQTYFPLDSQQNSDGNDAENKDSITFLQLVVFILFLLALWLLLTNK